MCVCGTARFNHAKQTNGQVPEQRTLLHLIADMQSLFCFSLVLSPYFSLLNKTKQKKKREEKFHCVNIQENVDTSLTRAVGLYGMLPHVHPRVADGEVQRRVERESTSGGGEKRQQRREKRTVLEGAALLICVYTIIEAYLPTRSPHASTVHISRRESVFLQLGSQTIGSNNNNTQ